VSPLNQVLRVFARHGCEYLQPIPSIQFFAAVQALREAVSRGGKKLILGVARLKPGA
jgi:hypothetical protein